MIAGPASGHQLLRVAGALLWLFAGIPAALVLANHRGSLGLHGLLIWAGAFAVFGAAFWRASSDPGSERGDARTVGLLVIESLAALTMFAMLCTGFETVLLVPLSVLAAYA
jgi:hypothetical protein